MAPDNEPASALPREQTALALPRPLGEILVALGIDSADVTLALHEQELGDPRRVGDLLLTAGAATRDDVARALAVQRAAMHVQATPPVTGGRRLGDILATLGAISPGDATIAAHEQDFGDTRPIGEVLVAHGVTTQDVIDEAVSIQSNDGLPPFPTAHSNRLRALQAVALLALVATAGEVLRVTPHRSHAAFLYACVSLPYLLAKLALSSRYRPVREEAPADLELSVVIPFYNEDPGTFERCLTSVLHQTRRAKRVFIIDDGSDDPRCLEIARQWAQRRPEIVVHRFPGNRGKREAQVWAFEQATTDVVCTVDSDTVLRSDAFAEGLKPLVDPSVQAVCGYARALNPDDNLLTRLIDVRYTNAFLFERGAHSVLGSVLCATGVLSFWRRSIVLDNQDDYRSQSFLGVQVGYGDDRRLTAYALRTGNVVLQETAVALTAVPSSLRRYVRQQIRWNKSFFRESLLLLVQSRPTRWAWWLGALELGYWMVLTTMLMLSVVVRPVLGGHAPSWQYAAFVALMAYARSIRMIGDHGRLLPTSFLIAPLYGVLNLVLLVPLRFYSLTRLRDSRWGTRRLGAKHRQTVDPAPTAEPGARQFQQRKPRRRDRTAPGWVLPAEVLRSMPQQVTTAPASTVPPTSLSALATTGNPVS